MKTVVYIAGPMTGKPELNFPAFERAAASLRASGYEVISPHEVNPDKGMPWAACMRRDIPELCKCDAIALLPGWEESKGARLEMSIAQALGMRRIFVGHMTRMAEGRR